jgi:hypothetical protein
MSDKIDQVKQQISELQEAIRVWGQRNSQSDPGAVMELRQTRKTLAASIQMLATLEAANKKLARSVSTITEVKQV